MSKCGSDDAVGTDGEPPEEVLPRAKVPGRVWKVGYPAGKFVVKPGKLVMVRAAEATGWVQPMSNKRAGAECRV